MKVVVRFSDLTQISGVDIATDMTFTFVLKSFLVNISEFEFKARAQLICLHS